MKESHLSVGDRCWYYENGLISFADITNVRVHLEGERTEFALYRVKKYFGDREIPTVHRSQLFKVPEERGLLINELRKDEKLLKAYRLDLESQANDYIPDPEKDDV